jgi:hypothetical protein
MIACTITVGALTYSGFYRSTCAAVLAAMALYPEARGISARAKP